MTMTSQLAFFYKSLFLFVEKLKDGKRGDTQRTEPFLFISRVLHETVSLSFFKIPGVARGLADLMAQAILGVRCGPE